MAVTIRAGKREDAAFLAKVMLLASRGHLARGVWDLIIGGDEQGCLDYLTRLALAEPASLCHYGSFLIAESDGHPAAALCGFDPREGGWLTVMQNQTNVAEQLGWTENDFRRSAERASVVWPCIPGQAEGAWIVENVCTMPQFRRRGLVDRLMGIVMDEGRRRKHRLAQITVLIDNTSALKAYEKAGFRVFEEKRSEEFRAALGAPGFQRLLSDL